MHSWYIDIAQVSLHPRGDLSFYLFNNISLLYFKLSIIILYHKSFYCVILYNKLPTFAENILRPGESNLVRPLKFMLFAFSITFLILVQLLNIL